MGLLEPFKKVVYSKNTKEHLFPYFLVSNIQLECFRTFLNSFQTVYSPNQKTLLFFLQTYFACSIRFQYLFDREAFTVDNKEYDKEDKSEVSMGLSQEVDSDSPLEQTDLDNPLVGGKKSLEEELILVLFLIMEHLFFSTPFLHEHICISLHIGKLLFDIKCKDWFCNSHR